MVAGEAACRNPNLQDVAGKRPAPRLLRVAPPGPIESEGTPLGIAQVLLRNPQTTDDKVRHRDTWKCCITDRCGRVRVALQLHEAGFSLRRLGTEIDVVLAPSSLQCGLTGVYARLNRRGRLVLRWLFRRWAGFIK